MGQHRQVLLATRAKPLYLMRLSSNPVQHHKMQPRRESVDTHAMSKCEELRKLALARQGTRWNRYTCISDYHGGAYECEYVSPFTRTAGNIDAEVMVLLQDWCSSEFLEKPYNQVICRLGYDPKLETNKNLIQLLRDHFSLSLTEVYATNLFPFIKQGALSNTIPQRDLDRAAREFALPQVDVVKPRLVICLGIATFNAMRTACCLRRVKNIESGINAPFSHNTSQIWCQAHTGRLGKNNRNRGGVDRVSVDWSAMATRRRIAA